MAYLLVTDGELALRLLVLVRKGLELLDRLTLRHLQTELDILLRVFMTRLGCVSIH